MTSVNILVALVLLLANCAGTQEKPAMGEATPNSSPEEVWGIRVEGIRLSAADYMLDFRYRILDPEKASKLINRENKPYLIDEKSGAKFGVPNPPKVGPLRQTGVQPKSNVVYFILFANPGKYVKPGDKVTVVIGDFRAENLVVQ